MSRASVGRAVAAASLVGQLDERARKAICDFTESRFVRRRFERAGILSRLHHLRREDGPRAISSLARDFADMHGCGIPEQDIRALLALLVEFVDELCQVEPTSLASLDLEETQLEGAENSLTMRRVLGASMDVSDMEKAAELDRRHAALQLTRARRLSAEAGRMRFSRAQAQA